MSKSKGRIVKLTESKNSVLGLDCSSSTIGFGLIDLDTFSLSAYGHIRPLDSKFELLERLNDTFDRIEELCKMLKPSVVSIEDIFIFMKGMSTAKTITILTAFNRICGLAAYKNSQKVLLYSVGEIRKTIKNYYKLNKIEKEDLPDIIREHLCPDFANMLNKKGATDKKSYDESDAIAVAWTYTIKENK